MISNFTGIVLQKRDFTEKDLLLVVLNQEGERLELIVKGAAGPSSKRRAHLELMNQIEGTIYSSRNHHYLQNVECSASFSQLKNHLDRVFHAQVLLEIIRKSTYPEHPDPELYHLLHDALEALNQESPHSLTVEMSLLKLANALGILPSFKQCSKCLESLSEDSASWDSSSGTVHCADCTDSSCEHLDLKYRKALEFFKEASHPQLKHLFLTHDEEQSLRSFIRRFFQSKFHDSMKVLEWA